LYKKFGNYTQYAGLLIKNQLELKSRYHFPSQKIY